MYSKTEKITKFYQKCEQNPRRFLQLLTVSSNKIALFKKIKISLNQDLERIT